MSKELHPQINAALKSMIPLLYSIVGNRSEGYSIIDGLPELIRQNSTNGFVPSLYATSINMCYDRDIKRDRDNSDPMLFTGGRQYIVQFATSKTGAVKRVSIEAILGPIFKEFANIHKQIRAIEEESAKNSGDFSHRAAILRGISQKLYNLQIEIENIIISLDQGTDEAKAFSNALAQALNSLKEKHKEFQIFICAVVTDYTLYNDASGVRNDQKKQIHQLIAIDPICVAKISPNHAASLLKNRALFDGFNPYFVAEIYGQHKSSLRVVSAMAKKGFSPYFPTTYTQSDNQSADEKKSTEAKVAEVRRFSTLASDISDSTKLAPTYHHYLTAPEISAKTRVDNLFYMGINNIPWQLMSPKQIDELINIDGINFEQRGLLGRQLRKPGLLQRGIDAIPFLSRIFGASPHKIVKDKCSGLPDGDLKSRLSGYLEDPVTNSNSSERSPAAAEIPPESYQEVDVKDGVRRIISIAQPVSVSSPVVVKEIDFTNLSVAQVHEVVANLKPEQRAECLLKADERRAQLSDTNDKHVHSARQLPYIDQEYIQLFKAILDQLQLVSGGGLPTFEERLRKSFRQHQRLVQPVTQAILGELTKRAAGQPITGQLVLDFLKEKPSIHPYRFELIEKILFPILLDHFQSKLKSKRKELIIPLKPKDEFYYRASCKAALSKLASKQFSSGTVVDNIDALVFSFVDKASLVKLIHLGSKEFNDFLGEYSLSSSDNRLLLFTTTELVQLLQVDLNSEILTNQVLFILGQRLGYKTLDFIIEKTSDAHKALVLSKYLSYVFIKNINKESHKQLSDLVVKAALPGSSIKPIDYLLSLLVDRHSLINLIHLGSKEFNDYLGKYSLTDENNKLLSFLDDELISLLQIDLKSSSLTDQIFSILEQRLGDKVLDFVLEKTPDVQKALILSKYLSYIYAKNINIREQINNINNELLINAFNILLAQRDKTGKVEAVVKTLLFLDESRLPAVISSSDDFLPELLSRLADCTEPDLAISLLSEVEVSSYLESQILPVEQNKQPNLGLAYALFKFKYILANPSNSESTKQEQAKKVAYQIPKSDAAANKQTFIIESADEPIYKILKLAFIFAARGESTDRFDDFVKENLDVARKLALEMFGTEDFNKVKQLANSFKTELVISAIREPDKQIFADFIKEANQMAKVAVESDYSASGNVPSPDVATQQSSCSSSAHTALPPAVEPRLGIG